MQLDNLINLVYKICSGCRKSLPLKDFHANTTPTGKDIKRPKCKFCTAVYNKAVRQKKLAKRALTDPYIKVCECGDLFNSAPLGGVKREPREKCKGCLGKNPLIKAYVPELKKATWVRLPEGYGKM